MTGRGGPVSFELDGRPVTVAQPGPASAGAMSLLEALRDHLGARSVKDGCSPQGQCGCCTVLVDGAPRVACVTPLRRVEGRSVTTLDGLGDEAASRWAEAFCATGASQCGFCTPGIIVRLEGLRRRGAPAGDVGAVNQGLLAHLCRCTGWRSILDAWSIVAGGGLEPSGAGPAGVGPAGVGRGTAGGRDLVAAARRAALEGGAAQRVSPEVALGRGGFADDDAPAGALVAVADGRGGWSIGDTLAEARAAAGRVPGRHSTVALRHPVEVPAGVWPLSLRTAWVDPAYLETDASWCAPGGEPASPLGNGGAFGGKVDSPVAAAARELADRTGRVVRVLWSREDAVRSGPKRPPLAAGVDPARGRVSVRVARCAGVADAIRAGLGPGLEVEVEEVDVLGPPTSLALRAAGWAEGVALRAAATGALEEVVSPTGGRARASVGPEGGIVVRVSGGEVLDEVVLRSFCLGAAHAALSWVTSEGIGVGEDGVPVDLTVRSLGVLRAVDTPPIEVQVEPSPDPAVAVSDAVFAAVAAAVWAEKGFPPSWPTGVRPG